MTTENTTAPAPLAGQSKTFTHTGADPIRSLTIRKPRHPLAGFMEHFIGHAQARCIADLCRGEEGAHFLAKLTEYGERIAAMPVTYGTEGVKQGDKIAVLHYFTGGADWYIVEKDSDPDGEGQVQAFGLADLGYGGELGYISLPEILAAGAEIDLYFTPCPLNEIHG